MGRGRKETSLLGALFNAITQSGTTVTRTKDFWGNPRTIVKNYDTGTTKEYRHNAGFWGNKTKVIVCKNGEKIAHGQITHDILGHDIERLQYNDNSYSIKKMNKGFWGNKTEWKNYDTTGKLTGHGNGRRGLIFNTYTQSYEGTCYACNGTGIFTKTGKPCRRCNGTGVFRKKN